MSETPPDWPTPRECHAYAFPCPLEHHCDETNRCLVQELRGRGWAVVPPTVAMPQPPVGYVVELVIPLGEPEPQPPEGYRWCDYAALHKDEYPELFEVLRYAYNGTDPNAPPEKPGEFRIPGRWQVRSPAWIKVR